MQRILVTFRGRVQGVGFRQTAVEIAFRFAVTGTVQNLPNGDVELVAQGEASELDRFVATIENQMARNIDKMSRRNEPASGDFDDFCIIR